MVTYFLNHVAKIHIITQKNILICSIFFCFLTKFLNFLVYYIISIIFVPSFLINKMDIKQTVNELIFGDLGEAQKAMKEIYLYYYPKLVLFVSYYIKSKHDAEEIVSDTFYAVWEQREKLVKVQNFNTYIYAIAKNNVFDFLKYREKTNMHIKYDASEVEYLVKSSSDPETDLIGKDLLDRLDDAIESLPAQNKIAFKLVRELRLKYKEAAEIMGISLKTLEAHVASATKKLEKILGEELNSKIP